MKSTTVEDSHSYLLRFKLMHINFNLLGGILLIHFFLGVSRKVSQPSCREESHCLKYVY